MPCQKQRFLKSTNAPSLGVIKKYIESFKHVALLGIGI